ncbi:hypothetical protein O6H91_10G058600 [Diphasiastrum complanatum]|uniref:Uncharacterized protein n=1 Tax=Diphasiastrum complanatum TaxID=34168 RepID=A0ACC2CHD1_DIPCM|nr:hypothetical protein O6H91_10G058600 [Diphasiastrum complanatum]
MRFSAVVPLWQLITVVAFTTCILLANIARLTLRIRSICQPIVNRQVERGVATVLLIQRIQHPILDIIFTSASVVVSVEFYTAFLPLLLWSGRCKLAIQMTLLMALCIYIGTFLKDLVSGSRPSAPPVRRFAATAIEKEACIEFGFPSSHAINTICLSVHLARHLDSTHIYVLWIAGFLLAITTAIVIYGRMYLGMHTPIDIIAGVIFGVILVTFWCFVDDRVNLFIEEGKNVFIFWTIICLLLLAAYPAPEKQTPSFEYHNAFVGVILGMVWGLRIGNYHYIRSALTIVHLNSWSGALVLVKRLVVGLPVVIAVKMITKLLAVTSLPWICLHIGLPVKSTTYVPALKGMIPVDTTEVDLELKKNSDSEKLLIDLKEINVEAPKYGDDVEGTKYGDDQKLPMATSEIDLERAEPLGPKNLNFWLKFFSLSLMEPLDVDTGIRLLQYAGLSWSAVGVSYIFKHFKI